MTSLTTPKRKAALAAVAAGSLMLLAACGGDTQPAAGAATDAGSGSGSKNIVFSPLGLQIPAMQDLAKGVQGYGQSKGFSVTVQDPALDPQKQATDLQSVVESGKAGGAWVIAVAPNALSALVKTAQEKKVALLLNGTPEDYGLSGMQAGITFDRIDYLAQGQAAGEELGNCINEKLDGTAQVLFEESSPGTAGKAEYEGAVKDALAKTAPDAEIVATTTVSERAKAQTDVGSALQGHPDIQAVFGQNDEGTLGALGAFAAAGKDLTCATETGGNDEVLQAVKDGKIYAVVALQFAEDMMQSFDTLTAMMADPTKDGQQLTVPQKVIKAGA
ncbi:sugar ABC transporter substrate-binding protein [Nocardioides sp. LS1]|uniref:sugar ABC transporter substrate-binding protein n=1 Tax=Nocardioides sp. LS1 TaxID=1027620 RepID=UPI000F624519|nr:sugar ABC transporter substrate-binding protein [Nocardioides sp. LS1]GCD89913.1 ribose import binding protein RbsB [Nocardioides sp. LS1]